MFKPTMLQKVSTYPRFVKAYNDFFEKELGADGTLYGVVDSGIFPEFHDMADIEGWDDIRILLAEPYLHGFESAAPYLVRLQPGGRFAEKLFEESAGGYWLTLIVSRKGLDGLANELREMIVVYSQMHERYVILRFYDPRNFDDYLAIHDERALSELFDDIGGAVYTIDAQRAGVIYRYTREGISRVVMEGAV